jgi:hypothetical protein
MLLAVASCDARSSRQQALHSRPVAAHGGECKRRAAVTDPGLQRSAGVDQQRHALRLAAKHGFERCCGALLAAGADAQLAGGRALALARAHHPRNGALLSTLSSAQHRPAGGALPGTACDVCGAQRAPETKLRTCARCLSAQYCGEACQHRDWPRHRVGCRARQAEAAAQRAAAAERAHAARHAHALYVV